MLTYCVYIYYSILYYYLSLRSLKLIIQFSKPSSKFFTNKVDWKISFKFEKDKYCKKKKQKYCKAQTILLHKYISDHYNHSVRITSWLVAELMLFVNFIRYWFKVDIEQQIFWETFHGGFIYSLSFFQKSAEGKAS